MEVVDEAEGPGGAQEPARRAQLPVRQRRRWGAGRGRVRVGGEGRAALESLALARPPRASHQPHPRTPLAPASQARPRCTPVSHLHPPTHHHCTHCHVSCHVMLCMWVCHVCYHVCVCMLWCHAWQIWEGSSLVQHILLQDCHSAVYAGGVCPSLAEHFTFQGTGLM